MPLTKRQIAELAQGLLTAQDTATPTTNVVDRYPDITVNEAYAVHREIFQSRIKSGDTVIGRKVGLSAKAMQEMFHTDAPVFGSLFASMLVLEGEPISLGGFCRPMLEGETAFVLKNDLRGPGATPAKVAASIAGIMPAFEIADTRGKEKPKKVHDLIADSSGAAKVILGGQFTPIDGMDLRHIGLVLEKDGEVIATGATAAVLGNPIHSVVKLVNKLAEFDMGLSAGEFVIPGTPHTAVPPEAGSCYRATFDRLGYVSARFTS